ncbi:MFS transporter [Photobacterium rosenbergii]|uniref:MFS transporter n=1 Tax=Photobacterium rosenbergii TaxID=294936 RepID=A0ABU3ZD29_9GAMM|nr:MFS transporter [Photobacterium rosenbergii]MDV5168022.1 MFS transporter [Photobacterium rosenbergii]
MSLVSMPFVDNGVDTALHVVAAVILFGSIAAAAFGFWRIHELPIQKAHKREHHQLGLITALTWIGFIWHWVWVVAVIIAFVDGEQALRHVRDIWKEKENHPEPAVSKPSASEAVVMTDEEVKNA